jgi:hypothetical protein
MVAASLMTADEERNYSCRGSCGGSVVLVDEAAEAVATADLARRRFLPLLIEFGRPEFERAVWPLAVVMVDVDAERSFEVAAVEDQQPVETLGTHSTNEALRDRVGFRRAHRRLHDPDAFAPEHLVEGAAVPRTRASSVRRAAAPAQASLGEQPAVLVADARKPSLASSLHIRR